MKKDQNPRLGRVTFVYGVIFVAVAGLLARLGYLQIVRGTHFRSEASNSMLVGLPVLPPRGWIYDRNHVLLAYDQPSFSIVLTRLNSPAQSYSALATRLAPVFGLKYQDLYTTLTTKNTWEPQTRILENASQSQVSYVVEHQSQLPGIHVVEDPQRVYQYGDLAGHVLGYIGYPSNTTAGPFKGYLNDQWVGLSGLEYEYESYLQGKVGNRVVQTNSLGVPLKDFGLDPAPKAGDSLVLTLDAHLQATAQQVVVNTLAQVRKLYGYTPKDAEVVMMNPKTGGVLSMVSYPYYDPNWYVTSKAYLAHAAYLNNATITPMLNHVLESPRAPGSTVKPVNILAGLESGVITPTTTIQDAGYANVGGYILHDWQPGGHGIVDPAKAIEESCDTFLADMAMWMADWHGGLPKGMSVSTYLQTARIKGLNQLFSWENKFGLGQLTGIDLPYELPGGFYDEGRPYSLSTSIAHMKKYGYYNDNGQLYDVAAASIGQSQQFTPIELAQYITTVANNGVKLQPHLVQQIVSPSGKVIKTFKPVVQARLTLNQQFLDVVKQGMYDVVNQPTGTAYGSFYNAPYKAAGKTGTAQITSAGREDISLFIGYAPVKNPQVAIAVMVPGGGESGQTAVPLARQLLDEYFKEHHEFFPKSQWTTGTVPANWFKMSAYTIPESAQVTPGK